MLSDSSDTSNGVITTDICVIGAGPAGISFAREFIGLSIDVCILESGLFGAGGRAQELADGVVEAENYLPDALGEGRARQFGGTANKWVHQTEPGDARRYARSLPAEPIDFEPGPARADQAWPFPFETLKPFYRRGQHVWNGGPFDYDPSSWGESDVRPLAMARARFTTRMSQHGPCDVFALGYRDDLLGADNISLNLGCTALCLESGDKAGSIQSIRVARDDGSTFLVAAKIVVLAGGGVENVQLLLLSDLTKPGAPGNRHDNVGRYLTDHPEFRMGTLMSASPDVFQSISLYDIRRVRQFLVSGFLTLTQALKKSENLLNFSAVLVPQEAGFGSEAHRSLVSLSGALRRGNPGDAFKALGPILRAPRDALGILRAHRNYQEYQGGWSRPEVAKTRFKTIEVWAASEQTPDRDNCISLAPTKDWLGRRQAKFEWRWSESDRANVARSVALLTTDLEASGLGQLKPWAEPSKMHGPIFPGLHHPMCGTRMHADPKFGVVDADCRVHGTDNLYAAGSSVFANGHGYANPTLTILALAVRLADHIKQRLSVSTDSRSLAALPTA